MNMSKTNYIVKINKTANTAASDSKTERRESHKHMQQARRSARSNKQFIRSL